MANRKYRVGTTVRVSNDADISIADRYIGRKGVVEALRGKTSDGVFKYGLRIHDRVSLLEVTEEDITKVTK